MLPPLAAKVAKLLREAEADDAKIERVRARIENVDREFDADEFRRLARGA